MVTVRTSWTCGLSTVFLSNSPVNLVNFPENFPENSIIYINQGYQSVKDNNRIHHGDYFFIGQVNVCQDREVKLFRSRYDPVTGNFLGLYEILGYIMIKGDPEEHVLDYGHSKQNSKILPSYYKKRVPSSFSGTFLNHHSLNLAHYRPHFQRLVVFLLLLRIGAKK